MTRLVLALSAVLAVSPVAAQSNAEFEAALAAVRSAVRAPAAQASPEAYRPAAAVPPSCADARELETSYDMTLTHANGMAPRVLRFKYSDCHEEGRNDYLPPYTERTYKADGGYILVITTNEGEPQSDVLLAKGNKWIGHFSTHANAALTSGNPEDLGPVAEIYADAELKSAASIRNSAKPAYPELKACETADWSKTGTSAPKRESDGLPARGWEGRMGASLVLLTKTAAYYYHEDCDICAEVTKCELSSGKLSSQIVAHSVDCADLKGPRSEPGVVYDACGPLPAPAPKAAAAPKSDRPFMDEAIGSGGSSGISDP